MVDGADILFGQAQSIFETAIERLCDGSIHFSSLDILLEYQQQVLDLFKLVDSHGGGVKYIPELIEETYDKADILRECLLCRNMEKQRFELVSAHFQYFCSKLKYGKFNYLFTESD